MDADSRERLSTEAKMIIASNLTVAAVIRDAALLVINRPGTDSRESVTQTFSNILRDLEKQSLGKREAQK